MDDKTRELVSRCIRSIKDLKTQEDEIRAKRIKAENWLMQTLAVKADVKGNESFENDEVKVTFSKNIDTKVNYDKLLEIRAQNKDLDYASLFRFKAEVNAKAFNNTTEDVRLILAPAITTKANKPTVEINYKEG